MEVSHMRTVLRDEHKYELLPKVLGVIVSLIGCHLFGGHIAPKYAFRSPVASSDLKAPISERVGP